MICEVILNGLLSGLIQILFGEFESAAKAGSRITHTKQGGGVYQISIYFPKDKMPKRICLFYLCTLDHALLSGICRQPPQ